MSNKVVCPITSSGATINRCHPLCKFINDDGSCKLVNFVDNINKLIKDKLSKN